MHTIVELGYGPYAWTGCSTFCMTVYTLIFGENLLTYV